MAAVAGDGQTSVGSTGSAVVSSSSSSSSSSATAAGGSRAQSSVSGQNASVTVNGHQLDVSEGQLRLDDVAYGEVTPEQTVTLSVEDGAVTVLVDGVERYPEE
ncbi:hypothetical protein BWR19_02985 [Halomonas sp. 1513]|nr:hypothetical protein BWR19_02985 [Halomonas sp. 1513]